MDRKNGFVDIEKKKSVIQKKKKKITVGRVHWGHRCGQYLIQGGIFNSTDFTFAFRPPVQWHISKPGLKTKEPWSKS